MRAFICLGNIISGACAGDLVTLGEIYQDTSLCCKSPCGVTWFITNVNVLIIAGPTCGVNWCNGVEYDILNPGVP